MQKASRQIETRAERSNNNKKRNGRMVGISKNMGNGQAFTSFRSFYLFYFQHFVSFHFILFHSIRTHMKSRQHTAHKNAMDIVERIYRRCRRAMACVCVSTRASMCVFVCVMVHIATHFKNAFVVVGRASRRISLWACERCECKSIFVWLDYDQVNNFIAFHSERVSRTKCNKNEEFHTIHS